MTRRGFLLVNLGTPAAPTVPAVRRYLREFLWDARVLDINPLLRAILLYGFILPTRPRSSAHAYRSIWSERGSPLLAHGDDLAANLGRCLGDDWQVELGMRYQQPSIAGALARFRQKAIHQIVVFPLFPHYSAAAWESAVEKVYSEASKLWDVPALQVVPPYYDHAAFIGAFAAVAQRALDTTRADKVLFSYHGLPERQILKSDASGAHCLTGGCCDAVSERNRNCYRAQCFATSRALAARLRLPAAGCETTFQSRLGRIPWIRPYTDERVRALAQSGVRRLAVLCPSFTADCLETLEEIGIRARADFIAHGGEELVLVPSLNSEAVWVDAVIRIAGDTADLRLQTTSQAPDVTRR
jgi:ferrochelatase